MLEQLVAENCRDTVNIISSMIVWEWLWAFLLVGVVLCRQILIVAKDSENIVIATFLNDASLKRLAEKKGIERWKTTMKKQGEKI